MPEKTDQMINELQQAANLLRTVKVDGEYWVVMQAIYNSMIQVVQFMQSENSKGGNTVEPINNSADT